jgi:uncharacterized protein DUF7019
MAGLQQDGPPKSLLSWEKKREEDELFAAMAIALHHLKPPTQDMEFLAKTLETGTVRGYESFIGVPSARVILGTPLYVPKPTPYLRTIGGASMISGDSERWGGYL